MLIRKAELSDVPDMLDIYNYEVIHGVSTLDLKQRTLDEWTEWFYSHNIGNHPLIVAEIDGKVAGYASLSEYRQKEAYKTTVELSIYIGTDFRRKGVATALMESIIQMAKDDSNTYTIVSVITSGNDASEKLHAKFGFEFCGTIRRVGIKFNEFQNIDNYYLGV